MQPLPLSPSDTPAARFRRADKLLATRRKLTPEFDAIHYMRADSPEECLFMMPLSFLTRMFWNLGSIHSYMNWLFTADMHQKYREYVDLLNVQQATDPTRRLVLKAPEHVDAIDALLDALPEAIVVQTYRDPVAQLASYLSLGETARSKSTEHPQRDADIATGVGLIETAIRRNAEARARYPGRVIDVRYNDLRRDPTGTVEEIYRRAGIEVSPALHGALAAHASANKHGKHGAHRYNLADYGLDAADIAQRFADPLA